MSKKDEALSLEEFKVEVNAWMSEQGIKSLRAASLHIGSPPTYLSRCFNGERPFPPRLLSRMGYKVIKPQCMYIKSRG